MMTNMFAAQRVAIVPAILAIVGLVLVIAFLIRMIRYFKTAGNEQKLIRMELGKLAEEVQQLRHELKGANDPESSTGQ